MKKTERLFDTLFATIAAILMSFIKHLAKFLVPIPPAWYWGTIISESSDSLMVGIFAAIVLEIGGMLAAHYAIAYYGTAKGHVATAMTLLYLLIGIGVMWLMEAVGSDTKLVITAVFIIAGMVYVLSAMTELENEDKARMEDDRQWQRTEAERDSQLRRQLRLQQQADKTAVMLAKVQATASTEPAQSKAEPAPASYECEDCQRTFGTVQALNAHGRHCLARKSLNGTGK